MSATSLAPKNLEQLKEQLRDDIKVKVAGTPLRIASSRGAMFTLL